MMMIDVEVDDDNDEDDHDDDDNNNNNKYNNNNNNDNNVKRNPRRIRIIGHDQVTYPKNKEFKTTTTEDVNFM